MMTLLFKIGSSMGRFLGIYIMYFTKNRLAEAVRRPVRRTCAESFADLCGHLGVL